MQLSPMQEIFILLEDEKEVPLFRLNRWGRSARGVLAKLKNLGWAEKIQRDKEPFYSITEKGEKEFDNVLKPLKSTGNWDGRWRLVMFDIPENKRDVRDRLRRSLAKLGMGILQGSVWISPNDVKKEVEEITERLKLQNSIKFFEVTRQNSLDKNIIERAWNLPEISDEYKHFNLESERLLNMANKIQNLRFSAKKLIFEYALILQKDPVMPSEFREKDDLRKKAHQNYLDLRKFVI